MPAVPGLRRDPQPSWLVCFFTSCCDLAFVPNSMGGGVVELLFAFNVVYYSL